ncbi:MAG: hypothetical protein KIT81_12330 [Alphaproteobacteria bacterium]|nr:hypothetical protein [Alphaproteobacteria bacterium]
MKRRLLLCFLVLLVASCAARERQRTAELAQTQLIGMSREELLSCAGRPASRASGERVEYFVFVRREGGGDPLGSEPVGATGGFSAPPSAGTPLRCEATVKLEQGRVATISYRGQSGGVLLNRQQVCGYIFERCVRK